MADRGPILVTGAGAGGGSGGVGGRVVRFLREQGRTVRAMVHHDDERAEGLRALGAEVVAGDLTNPADVGRVLDGCPRAYFGMSVAASYLEAAATVASVARSLGGLEVLVSISQMTVSQMTPVSTEEWPAARSRRSEEQGLRPLSPLPSPSGRRAPRRSAPATPGGGPGSSRPCS